MLPQLRRLTCFDLSLRLTLAAPPPTHHFQPEVPPPGAFKAPLTSPRGLSQQQKPEQKWLTSYNVFQVENRQAASDYVRDTARSGLDLSLLNGHQVNILVNQELGRRWKSMTMEQQLPYMCVLRLNLC
jgi:hypothetical protein